MCLAFLVLSLYRFKETMLDSTTFNKIKYAKGRGKCSKRYLLFQVNSSIRAALWIYKDRIFFVVQFYCDGVSYHTWIYLYNAKLIFGCNFVSLQVWMFPFNFLLKKVLHHFEKMLSSIKVCCLAVERLLNYTALHVKGKLLYTIRWASHKWMWDWGPHLWQTPSMCPQLQGQTPDKLIRRMGKFWNFLTLSNM